MTADDYAELARLAEADLEYQRRLEARLTTVEAERDLLRRQHQGQADHITALRTRVAQADARLAAVEADRDQLIDRLTAAKALHVPQTGQGPAYCRDCDQRWPCPTRAVLSAAPTDTTKET